jgi:hypothetical protein
MEQEPKACDAWAPEAVFDAARQEWVIFWATTIPGRFAVTDHEGDNACNHAI